MAQLARTRRSIFPQSGDTWDAIARRELPEEETDAAVSMLQSWNLHVFMRATMAMGGQSDSNPILPSDIIFLEPPLA